MRIAKIEIVLFAIVCIAVLLLPTDPLSIGIYTDCRWWQHLTYQFAHANIFHLAVNIYVMYFCITRFNLSQSQILSCFIISAILPALSHIPTIGASGIVYAMLGIINTMVVEKAKFAAWIALYITISYFFNNNWCIHLCCYLLGFLSNYIAILCTNLKRLS